jgi:ribosomal-protein-alanine N-acetyltransferase
MWLRKEKPKPSGIVMLTCPGLVLRPAASGDYAQWSDVRSKNADYLKPYEPAWPAGCLASDFFKRRVERLGREWAQDHTYAFLIFKKDGALIGGININNVMRGAAQMASLGYWLDESHQGHGHMTQACRAVLDYAFSTLGLVRMNAATLVHNEKSRNMLLRLGFTEEGFARSYIQIDGKRQDHILFGLNAADFSRPS